MRIYEAALLDRLLERVQERGILCIADEVLTGFGRTGKLFAGEYLRTHADIICLSKGLTGGTMALGVTAATERIFGAFLSDERRKALFHGHSFTANPLACAASLASLDLLLEPDCLQRIRAIAGMHLLFSERIKDIPVIRNIRIIGTIIAFEIGTGEDGYLNPVTTNLTRDALNAGIYLRPLGNTVYIMPPYCTTEKEMDQVYTFLVQYINGITV
jgi:adenosylmethionine-8-amino-7-oxononanoate aminotransferase